MFPLLVLVGFGLAYYAGAFTKKAAEPEPPDDGDQIPPNVVETRTTAGGKPLQWFTAEMRASIAQMLSRVSLMPTGLEWGDSDPATTQIFRLSQMPTDPAALAVSALQFLNSARDQGLVSAMSIPTSDELTVMILRADQASRVAPPGSPYAILFVKE